MPIRLALNLLQAGGVAVPIVLEEGMLGDDQARRLVRSRGLARSVNECLTDRQRAVLVEIRIRRTERLDQVLRKARLVSFGARGRRRDHDPVRTGQNTGERATGATRVDEDDAAALDSIQQLAVLRVGKVAARDVQRGIGSVEGSMPEEEDEHLIVGANGTAELLDVLSDVLGRRGAIHEIAIGQPCLGEYADSIRRKSEAIDEQRARLAQV